MRKFSYGLAIVAMAVATAGVALAVSNSNSAGEANPKASKSTVYKMNPTGLSGQKGTVTVTPLGSSTKVVINITGEPAGAHQPAHIHVGACAHPGGVKIPLTDVVAGHSTTIVHKPLSQVVVAGTSVNTHKSAAEMNVYKACANLSMGTSM